MRGTLDIEGLDPIEAVLLDFARSLRSRGRSPRTIQGYVEAAKLFDAYLIANDLPRELRNIGRASVEGFIADQLARHKATSAASRYRSLQQFFNWAVSTSELRVSPMATMKPPTVAEAPVPIVELDHLRLLLKACNDRTFEGYRDTALILLFVDTGCRLSEITNLSLDDVDLESRTIDVLGKGGRLRSPSFDDPTRKALRLYLRARQTHALAGTPWLWLGSRGKQLTQSGIAQMLRRRCEQAGIPPVHPHQFRHTYAHQWLAEGGNEGDLMRLAGWKSREMLARYGASAADERARDSYRLHGGISSRL